MWQSGGVVPSFSTSVDAASTETPFASRQTAGVRMLARRRYRRETDPLGTYRAKVPSCQTAGFTTSFEAAMPNQLSEIAGQAADVGNKPANTLGALLYADRSAVSIPEDDWVRLVHSIAAGDQQALRALYERSHRLVFTLAMRISRDRETAEEVTLDVFRDIWLRSAQYAPEGGSVIGWIMNQARSRAIDRLRFEQRKKRVLPASVDREEGHVEDPENTVDFQRRRSRLQGALAALTPAERQTIETAFFSELTYSETALRLDQPLGTVKTRVRAALAKLRKALEGEGGSP
jgi:RNA polymerase sigma-70 factor, ECF subfamily